MTFSKSNHDFNELKLFVKAVRGPLFNSGEWPSAWEYKDALAYCKNISLALSNYSFSNQPLDEIRRKVLSTNDWCLKLLERIHQIELNKPMMIEADDSKVIYASTEEEKEQQTARMVARSAALMLANSSKEKLQEEFRDTLWKMRWHVAEITEVAKEFQTNVISNPILLKLGYSPAWQGVYSSDRLSLENISGQNLDDAVLIITVSNTKYRTTHVHYVDSWPVNAIAFPKYRYTSDKYRNHETRDAVSELIVTIHTPNIQQTTKYAYSEKSRDNGISDYCKNVKLTTRYLPMKSTFLGLSHEEQGISFSFSGISRLPASEIHITFFGEETKELYWNMQKMLESEKSYDFRSEKWNFVPGEYEIEIRLQETAFIIKSRFFISEIDRSFSRTDYPNVEKWPNGAFKPAPGYAWANNKSNNYEVKWSPGSRHYSYPNAIATETEGQWRPANGYTWASNEPGNLGVKIKASS